HEGLDVGFGHGVGVGRTQALADGGHTRIALGLCPHERGRTGVVERTVAAGQSTGERPGTALVFQRDAQVACVALDTLASVVCPYGLFFVSPGDTHIPVRRNAALCTQLIAPAFGLQAGCPAAAVHARRVAGDPAPDAAAFTELNAATGKAWAAHE